MLPVRGNFVTGFRKMDVLLDMIDPGHRNEMVVVAVGRTLLRELDFFRSLKMIDFADGLVGLDNVHVLFDLRGVGIWKSPLRWKLETFGPSQSCSVSECSARSFAGAIWSQPRSSSGGNFARTCDLGIE